MSISKCETTKEFRIVLETKILGLFSNGRNPGNFLSIQTKQTQQSFSVKLVNP